MAAILDFYETRTLNLYKFAKNRQNQSFCVGMYIQMYKQFIGMIFKFVSARRNPRWRPFLVFYGIRTLNLL